MMAPHLIDFLVLMVIGNAMVSSLSQTRLTYEQQSFLLKNGMLYCIALLMTYKLIFLGAYVIERALRAWLTQ